jgi:hypothetical protein
MGWGNGISIGWPNASAYVALQESYNIYSCAVGDTLVTNPYPIGSFQPGYRIQIDEGLYGYVDSITTSTQGGYSIANFPIGYVANQCNDADVELSWNIDDGDPGTFTCYLYAQKIGGEANINANSNPLSVYIYYNIILENAGGSTIFREGTVVVTAESYSINNTYDYIGEAQAFTAPNGYYIINSDSQIVSLFVANNYNSFNYNGGDIDNRWVTNYGNVWTFYGNGIG